MTPSSLVKLVRSLSSAEKRHFKLQSKMQTGDKEYLRLFDLIDSVKHPDIQFLKSAYRKRSPKSSWENTCVYLGDMIIDALVRAKKDKDVTVDLLRQLQGVKIMKDRSLNDEAFKQIKKIQHKAAVHQMPWIEYYCHRYELHHYSDENFLSVNDAQLVKVQMRGKDVLKSLNHIHDHYSLYELLQYRLIHGGRIVSEEDKKKLNDLMLSEMVLVAGKSKSFTSQKLHLLFQSFFFTTVADYHSALKSFQQLNDLMEKHEHVLDNPPLDYFSTLTGIINSLRMLQNQSEIDYYLQKLKKLDQPGYPSYFRYLVRKTFYTQQVLSLIQENAYEAARILLESIPEDVMTGFPLADEEKQCELYFYTALVYFELGNYKKAHLQIREIMNQLKLPVQLLVSKAIRLLNIAIYYHKGEFLHLEYEIRAYKRYFSQTKLMKVEKLLFKVAGSSPTNKRASLQDPAKRKLMKDLETVGKDKYEQRLLQYWDIREWAAKRFPQRRKDV